MYHGFAFPCSCAEIPFTTSCESPASPRVRVRAGAGASIGAHAFSGQWSHRRLLIVSAIALTLLASTVGVLRARFTVPVVEVPFSEFLADLDRGVVTGVIVSGDVLDVKLATGSSVRTIGPSNYL